MLCQKAINIGMNFMFSLDIKSVSTDSDPGPSFSAYKIHQQDLS